MRNRRFIAFAVLAVAIAGMTYWAYQRSLDVSPLPETRLDVNAPAEREYVYESERGGFSVLVPRGWRVAERSDEQSFEVVLFPDIYGDRVPESFSTRTHVSIFPYGTGSGGVLPWISATSSLTNPNDGARAIAYVTRSGEPWGWSLSFAGVSQDAVWRSWGLVYGSLDMIQDEPVCLDGNGVAKEMRECDPLTGDRVSRGGRIDRSDETTLLRVLRSVDVR